MVLLNVDVGQKPMISTPSAIPHSYGYQGTSKKIDIPNGRVGVIIGKGGETIKYLQLQSGAKIQVTRDMDADPNSPTRLVELMGTPDQIAKAEQLINDVLSEVVLHQTNFYMHKFSFDIDANFKCSYTLHLDLTSLIKMKGAADWEYRKGLKIDIWSVSVC